RVALWVLDPAAGTLTIHPDARGFGPGEPEDAGPIPCSPDGGGPLDEVVFHDRVLRTNRGMAGIGSTSLRGQLEAFGVPDAVVVPWRAGEQRLGAIAVYGSASGGFSEEDVLVLRAAATAAALLRHDQQSARLEGVKANFMRLASHELRSPLSVVRGYVSMME